MALAAAEEVIAVDFVTPRTWALHVRVLLAPRECNLLDAHWLPRMAESVDGEVVESLTKDQKKRAGVNSVEDFRFEVNTLARPISRRFQHHFQ